MFRSVILTGNGTYHRDHDTYDSAWRYVQAFLAVTNTARYRIVEEA
jgi:hypothetical protein